VHEPTNDGLIVLGSDAALFPRSDVPTVEDEPTAGIPCFVSRSVEVITRIMGHAKPSHDGLRTLVQFGSVRHNLVELELVESETSKAATAPSVAKP
jgi:hypothetical protein